MQCNAMHHSMRHGTARHGTARQIECAAWLGLGTSRRQLAEQNSAFKLQNRQRSKAKQSLLTSPVKVCSAHDARSEAVQLLCSTRLGSALAMLTMLTGHSPLISYSSNICFALHHLHLHLLHSTRLDSITRLSSSRTWRHLTPFDSSHLHFPRHSSHLSISSHLISSHLIMLRFSLIAYALGMSMCMLNLPMQMQSMSMSTCTSTMTSNSILTVSANVDLDVNVDAVANDDAAAQVDSVDSADVSGAADVFAPVSHRMTRVAQAGAGAGLGRGLRSSAHAAPAHHARDINRGAHAFTPPHTAGHGHPHDHVHGHAHGRSSSDTRVHVLPFSEMRALARVFGPDTANSHPDAALLSRLASADRRLAELRTPIDAPWVTETVDQLAPFTKLIDELDAHGLVTSGDVVQSASFKEHCIRLLESYKEYHTRNEPQSAEQVQLEQEQHARLEAAIRTFDSFFDSPQGHDAPWIIYSRDSLHPMQDDIRRIQTFARARGYMTAHEREQLIQCYQMYSETIQITKDLYDTHPNMFQLHKQHKQQQQQQQPAQPDQARINSLDSADVADAVVPVAVAAAVAGSHSGAMAARAVASRASLTHHVHGTQTLTRTLSVGVGRDLGLGLNPPHVGALPSTSTSTRSPMRMHSSSSSSSSSSSYSDDERSAVMSGLQSATSEYKALHSDLSAPWIQQTMTTLQPWRDAIHEMGTLQTLQDVQYCTILTRHCNSVLRKAKNKHTINQSQKQSHSHSQSVSEQTRTSALQPRLDAASKRFDSFFTGPQGHDAPWIEATRDIIAPIMQRLNNIRIISNKRGYNTYDDLIDQIKLIENCNRIIENAKIITEQPQQQQQHHHHQSHHTPTSEPHSTYEPEVIVDDVDRNGGHFSAPRSVHSRMSNAYLWQRVSAMNHTLFELTCALKKTIGHHWRSDNRSLDQRISAIESDMVRMQKAKRSDQYTRAEQDAYLKLLHAATTNQSHARPVAKVVVETNRIESNRIESNRIELTRIETNQIRTAYFALQQLHWTRFALQCGAVRCGAVRCGAVRCGAVRCAVCVPCCLPLI